MIFEIKAKKKDKGITADFKRRISSSKIHRCCQVEGIQEYLSNKN